MFTIIPAQNIIGCHAKDKGMVAFNQFGFQEHVSVILSFAAFLEASHC